MAVFANFVHGPYFKGNPGVVSGKKGIRGFNRRNFRKSSTSSSRLMLGNLTANAAGCNTPVSQTMKLRRIVVKKAFDTALKTCILSISWPLISLTLASYKIQKILLVKVAKVIVLFSYSLTNLEGLATLESE